MLYGDSPGSQRSFCTRNLFEYGECIQEALRFIQYDDFLTEHTSLSACRSERTCLSTLTLGRILSSTLSEEDIRSGQPNNLEDRIFEQYYFVPPIFPF